MDSSPLPDSRLFSRRATATSSIGDANSHLLDEVRFLETPFHVNTWSNGLPQLAFMIEQTGIVMSGFGIAPSRIGKARNLAEMFFSHSAIPHRLMGTTPSESIPVCGLYWRCLTNPGSTT